MWPPGSFRLLETYGRELGGGAARAAAAAHALAVGALPPPPPGPASDPSGGNLRIQTGAGQSGPGAPAHSFKRSPQPASGSRLRDTGAGRGRVNLLPRLQGSNTDASGCRRSRPAAAGRPWSAPCTVSPSGAGVPTQTCPSTSPPLVSARDSWLPALLRPTPSARKDPPPHLRDTWD